MGKSVIILRYFAQPHTPMDSVLRAAKAVSAENEMGGGNNDKEENKLWQSYP